MRVSEEQFDRLTSQVYSAALDASQWQGVLDSLREMSGGVRTHIFGHDLKTGHTLVGGYSGYGEEFIDSWTDYYAVRNAWAPGFFESEVGRTIPSEAMCATEDLTRTEFYNDWVRPQEDIRSGGGTVLAKNGSAFFALGGNIRARDVEILQAPFLSLVQRLTPHLQNALAISRRIGALELENTVLAHAAAGPDAAVLALTAARGVVYANRTAQRHLAGGGVLRTDMRGRVTLADPAADARLAAALATLHGAGRSASGAFPLAGSTAPLVCRMARVDLPDLALHPALFHAEQLFEPCLLLTLCEGFSQHDAASALMVDHGLSRAEAKVATAMAAGRAPSDIAEARGTSLHTVRNQLKSALSKTGQHSQRGLARLVYTLGA